MYSSKGTQFLNYSKKAQLLFKTITNTDQNNYKYSRYSK